MTERVAGYVRLYRGDVPDAMQRHIATHARHARARDWRQVSTSFDPGEEVSPYDRKVFWSLFSHVALLGVTQLLVTDRAAVSENAIEVDRAVDGLRSVGCELYVCSEHALPDQPSGSS